MLNYVYKGKYCPTSTLNTQKNWEALFYYQTRIVLSDFESEPPKERGYYIRTEREYDIDYIKSKGFEIAEEATKKEYEFIRLMGVDIKDGENFYVLSRLLAPMPMEYDHISDMIYLRMVYNTYNTLCNFNNRLVKIEDKISSELNDNDYKKQNELRKKTFEDTMGLLVDYLNDNQDIVEQNYDRHIKHIYEELVVCFNRLNGKFNTLSNVLPDIKKKIVMLMKHYEKMGVKEGNAELFSKSSSNLKENNYDYV